MVTGPIVKTRSDRKNLPPQVRGWKVPHAPFAGPTEDPAVAPPDIFKRSHVPRLPNEAARARFVFAGAVTATRGGWFRRSAYFGLRLPASASALIARLSKAPVEAASGTDEVAVRVPGVASKAS